METPGFPRNPDATPTGATPGSCVVRGAPACTTSCSLAISLRGKHSFCRNFKHKHTHVYTHTHTHTEEASRIPAASCEMCEEARPAGGSPGRLGGWSLPRRLPGRDVRATGPAPGSVLHQVLPSAASPHTSKEVFLYSPGRSVNWPAASKAEPLTLRGPWGPGGVAGSQLPTPPARRHAFQWQG